MNFSGIINIILEVSLMTIIAIIISLASMIIAFFPYTGILVGLLAILSNFAILKSTEDFEQRKVLKITFGISILTTVIAIVFSGFALFTSLTMDKSVATSNDIDISIIQQDASTLQSEVDEFITTQVTVSKNSKSKNKVSREDAIKELLLEEQTKIYQTKEDTKTWNERMQAITATKDSDTVYYTIDYNVLGSNFAAEKRNYWVIDEEGNVYLNTKDLSKYVSLND